MADHFVATAPAPTTCNTLSLHDALPISRHEEVDEHVLREVERDARLRRHDVDHVVADAVHLHVGDDVIYVVRSEEHTSELQSHVNLVCRPLLEKKNTLPNAATLSLAALY